MLRSSAASVRLADVTTTASSSTTALAWRTLAPPSGSRERGSVEDALSGRARPFLRPEAVGEPPHQMIGAGAVALPALDVQQQVTVRPGVSSIRRASTSNARGPSKKA